MAEIIDEKNRLFVEIITNLVSLLRFNSYIYKSNKIEKTDSSSISFIHLSKIREEKYKQMSITFQNSNILSVYKSNINQDIVS